MSIERMILDNGEERYVVRVKRYGCRKVLGRFASPMAAIHVECEFQRQYLIGVWLDGKEKSRGSV